MAKAKQAELFATAKPEKLGDQMAVVLECINEAAGTSFPMTKAKVRWLKSIVQGTPKANWSKDWWLAFFSWVFQERFAGRVGESLWSVDLLAKGLDKYLDAYSNRERFAKTRGSGVLRALDEWEIVLDYVVRLPLGAPWAPPWGEATAKALSEIGGALAVRQVRQDYVKKLRSQFVSAWIAAVDGKRPAA